MIDGVLDHLSDNVLEVRGPVDTSTDAAFNTIVAGTTVTGRLFNVALDTVVIDLVTELTADQITNDTVLAVKDITGFTISDFIRIELDNGQVHESTISATPSGGQITIGVALPSDASKFNKVSRVKLSVNATFISVKSVDGWRIGYSVRLVQEDMTEISRTVSQVLTDPCPFIVISADIDQLIIAGSTVKNQVGPDLTNYVDFGTPQSPAVPEDPNTGYRATIGHDHLGLEPGMFVRSESVVVDGTINLLQTSFATVKAAGTQRS